MIDYSLIETPQQLKELNEKLNGKDITSIAMDFEEESNLHVYGEHLCLIQIYDGTSYYVIDAVKLLESGEGKSAVKDFLESPVEKIMFDCSSDAAIVRKTLGIRLNSIYDVRVIAKALDFMGNLTALIERNLGIKSENPALKKKYQKTNWMKRPLTDEQIEYALGDVTYLFRLKQSLQEEVSQLPSGIRNRIKADMRNCANRKHSEKPGWEKICNYKALNRSQKTYLRYFFNARDELARKANVPPTNIIEKQLLVKMAKEGSWENSLDKNKLKYKTAFENARQAALNEINGKNL